MKVGTRPTTFIVQPRKKPASARWLATARGVRSMARRAARGARTADVDWGLRARVSLVVCCVQTEWGAGRAPLAFFLLEISLVTAHICKSSTAFSSRLRCSSYRSSLTRLSAAAFCVPT